MTTLAILSDTHDQVANLQTAINYCNAHDVDVIAHCGDLISPFMLKQLTRFNGPVHLIYGNNIGDQRSIADRCGRDFPNIRHHGIVGIFSVEGYQIAMVHYPQQAVELASRSIYDIVCCGHSHKAVVKRYEKSLLINPGALLGENDEAGFALVDFENGTTRRVKVGICMFDREIPIVETGVEQLHLDGLGEI